MTEQCRYCGNFINQDIIFCPYCGTKQYDEVVVISEDKEDQVYENDFNDFE